MAALHIVQIAHLTQDLIEHIKNANNLVVRSKYELDRIHQVTKMLINVVRFIVFSNFIWLVYRNSLILTGFS